VWICRWRSLSHVKVFVCNISQWIVLTDSTLAVCYLCLTRPDVDFCNISWSNLSNVTCPIQARRVQATGQLSAAIHVLITVLYKLLFVCLLNFLLYFFLSLCFLFYSFAIILVYFLTYLSTLLLVIILCCNISCYVCFVIVCFSFSVLSQEIGWEESVQAK